MRDKLWVLTILFFISCAEDEFPEGVYHYQVERLLSGGESKTWLLASSTTQGVTTIPSGCEDSLRLLVTALTDSVRLQRLEPTNSCQDFDTISLGNANASGTLVFTDSLIFNTGSIWIIQSILPDELRVMDGSEEVNYVVE